LISLLKFFFQPFIMVGSINVIDPMEDNIFFIVIKLIIIKSIIINVKVLKKIKGWMTMNYIILFCF
jgi:hypothetical protein